MRKLSHKPERYLVTKSGYVIDRHLTRIFILFLFIMVIILFFNYGFKTNCYISCPQDAIGGACINSFYGDDRFPNCNKKEFLLPGETIGNKEPPVLDACLFLSFFLFVGLIIFNHGSQATDRYENARRNK